MGIFIYQVNEAGELILIEANPATERILGFDTKSYLGKRLEDIFPNVIGTELPDRYKKAAVSGKPGVQPTCITMMTRSPGLMIS